MVKREVQYNMNGEYELHVRMQKTVMASINDENDMHIASTMSFEENSDRAQIIVPLPKLDAW